MPPTGVSSATGTGGSRNGSNPAASNSNGSITAAQSGQRSVSAASAKPVAGKKAKSHKVTDPSETEKLLAAKISQLELDAAGEKDQEQEIGMFAGLESPPRKRRRHS